MSPGTTSLPAPPAILRVMRRVMLTGVTGSVAGEGQAAVVVVVMVEVEWVVVVVVVVVVRRFHFCSGSFSTALADTQSI